MRVVVGEAIEKIYWIGGVGAAIDGGEKELELLLFNFANDELGLVIVERIGTSQNINAKGVTDVEADATTAHSLSINMKKIKTVEGKVRVVRKRADNGFADRNGIELRLADLGLVQCEMRRE